MKNIKNTIYESSLYLLLLMFISLFITFTLFYLKIRISIINFPLSIIITTILFYLLRKKLKIENFKKVLITSFIVLISTMTISTFIYDRSSDGNTYHKDAISNLKNGWNPVYESSKEFTDKYYKDTGYDMSIYTVWKDHYAKANWVMEANIYSLTNNIESAKSINLIFMYILFGISFYYFSNKLDTKKGLILSLILTLNPVTSSQLFTFYNDQLGFTCLYTLIISLISIIDKNERENTISNFYIMSLSFIICTNLKFNIMGYALVFTFIFMLKYLYDNKERFKELFKKLVLLFIPLFIISLIHIGYSTYITNFIDHKNPFFPVYGENGEDIITAQEPVEFLKYNNFQKVFYATFSKVNNLMEDRTANLKIPFTFDIKELKTTASVDTRISGYGIFFSGILILSLLIIMLKYKKLNKAEKQIIITLLLVVIGITFGISEGWWARYNPTIYIISLIALYVMLKHENRKILYIIFTCIISVNTLMILILNTGYTMIESIKTNKTLFDLKNKEITYNLNYGEPIGLLSNLDDFNITYHYKDIELTNKTYYNFLNYEKEEKHEK